MYIDYYSCDECSFRTTNSSSATGQYVHKPINPSSFSCSEELAPLKCPTCAFTAHSLIQLRYHFYCQHQETSIPLKETLKTCEKCEFQTYSDYLWIRHSLFICKNKQKEKPSTLKCEYGTENKEPPSVQDHIILREPKNQSNKRKKTPSILKCEYRTENKEPPSVKDHISLRQPKNNSNKRQKTPSILKCEYQTENKEPPSVQDHIILREPKNEKVYLYCPECHFKTMKKGVLKRHRIRIHLPNEEGTWLACAVCGAQFRDKILLRAHIKCHGSSGNSLKCDSCEFVTNSAGALKTHELYRHMRHGGLKWYHCEQCEYKVAERYCLLEKHVRRVHLGEDKLSTCPHCPLKFRSGASLDAHILRFHWQEHVDIGFQYPICPYRPRKKICIENKYNFPFCRHYEISQKFYKCEKCDFRTGLYLHLKWHTKNEHEMPNDEKTRYPCEKCPYTAKVQYLLSRHMKRMHTLPDPEVKFECPHCNYVAFKKFQLMQHLTRKHKSD